MKKAQKQPESWPAPTIVGRREEAASKILNQIKKGEAIRDAEVRAEEDLRNRRAEMTKWQEYNIELLGRLFDNPSIAETYSKSSWSVGVISMHRESLFEMVNHFKEAMNKKLTRLEAIYERLELIPEQGLPVVSKVSVTSQSREIFVVHGHDEALRESVARFLEKLDLKPIILHERPNQGRTIIEKIEQNSAVGFAVVLLTPDDVGASQAETTNLQPRARQNVILELGYFVGLLGRAKVCALYDSSVA